MTWCEWHKERNPVSLFCYCIFLVTGHPVGGKLALNSETKASRHSDGTSLRWQFTSIKHSADTDRTRSIYVGCTFCSVSFSYIVNKKPFPSSSSSAKESVYFNKPKATTSPTATHLPSPPLALNLKCGSWEMKRLRQVKLSSSPRCTFVVVIHSWQNPFTLWQPMSPLMYSVVSCHDLCNVRQVLTDSLPPHSQHITLAQAGCDVRVRALFTYKTALIHDRENALMRVSSKKSV